LDLIPPIIPRSDVWDTITPLFGHIKKLHNFEIGPLKNVLVSCVGLGISNLAFALTMKFLQYLLYRERVYVDYLLQCIPIKDKQLIESRILLII
jgi:hypothetical protein